MNRIGKFVLGAASLCLLSGLPAVAEDGWSGESSLSAGLTTGNTETSEAGLGIDLDRGAGDWNFGIQFSGDYGKEDGVESRNRYFGAVDLEHDFNDTMFTFGRASYEVDQFTGFDSRTFVGGGVGWHVLDDEDHHWTVRGGPGFKIDEVKRQITTDSTGAETITPASTEESLGAVAQSEYFYAFNEAVSLSNKTNVVYGQESTQINNSIGLTAALNGHLAARVSFDVRHDTAPQPTYEATDTATKFSLVYTLGD
ncbi:DUF481 domain-containing protein [Hyphomonas sp. UBA4494]|jgi:putative salt-induced outer membrane protein YdiY|uniref:DUF481 domain-containing protein n=1 Tax=Hyphomonas sp. UBA4494 TaxID=1946631 RepID=UPI0025BE2F0E|nr:DUF481 domain-containing protein [Hyphomonas sp. UBA4494]